MSADEKLEKLMIGVAEIKKDIGGLVDNHANNTSCIKDHEFRIRALEGNQNKAKGMWDITSIISSAVIGVIVGLIIKFF